VRIGIDLGGTKIEIAAFADDDAVVLRRRVASSSDYAHILDTIGELVAAAEKKIGPNATIGIGTPGAVSRATGRIKNANSVCLNGRPLLQDLAERLGPRVRIANDANCFALSEAIDGAGAGARVVFGVILGTGVGGGIVVDGRVLDGPNGIAGEWGHNPLPGADAGDLPAQRCYCGRTGCIETYLSGPGWAADFALHHPGDTPRAPEIVARARAGEPAAAQSFDRYCDRLARALGAVINVLDPDVIVLGGGLSNIDELYVEVPRRWDRYVFSDRVDTRLARNVHGDSSGVRGAAFLWPPAGGVTASRSRTSS
jgi:predicted NBD/HSP70 family sugar kinase